LPAETDEKYLARHVILVGYGRVGRRIAEALDARGIPYVVAEQNRELVEWLRSRGIAAVSGDGADPSILVQAHVARADMLVVATPDTFDVRRVISCARTLNPGIKTVVRTHNEEEATLLAQEQAGEIFFGEHELAKGMILYVTGQLDRNHAPKG
jgi:CPA2 family monovalent cation:H+ antiporter-2